MTGLVIYRNGSVMWSAIIGDHDDERGSFSVRVENGWYEDHYYNGKSVHHSPDFDIISIEPCDWSDNLNARITRRGP